MMPRTHSGSQRRETVKHHAENRDVELWDLHCTSVIRVLKHADGLCVCVFLCLWKMCVLF